MAFQTKVDRCGLSAIANTLLVRDDAYNGSNQVYQPNGGNGDILGVEPYGESAAPTNSYGIPSPGVSFAKDAVKLNAITVVGNKNFALESIAISTGPNAPTLSAVCKLIEDAATAANQCVYKVPAFSISSKHHAQILFDAFTLGGTGANLTGCDAKIGCTVDVDDVEGTNISSDAGGASIVVSGTIIVNGSAVPTITPKSGWTLTKSPHLTDTNPEAQWKNYSFELVLPLEKTEPTPPSNGQNPQST